MHLNTHEVAWYISLETKFPLYMEFIYGICREEICWSDLMLMRWNPEGRGLYYDFQKSLFPIFHSGTCEMSWACFLFPRTSNFLSLESFRGRSSEVLWEGLKFILKFWHEGENCQSRRFLLRFCFLNFFFFSI